MADLMRAHDWGATALGAIGSWSESLVASVNSLLNSPFPSAVFWGADLILLYNDGYKPFLGGKHPAALGRRARASWEEVWEAVGPSLEDAFRRGTTSNVKNALIPILIDGQMEDRYWTYCFYPLYEQGQIAGVAQIAFDSTSELLGKLKLEESESRTSRILQSIGDAVIVTNAETQVTRMNPVAEALTGWTSDEAQGHLLADVFDIVNETTRRRVESPGDKVKRLGSIVGLANHTILIRRDGVETSIDDSGAPIRNAEGEITGIVVIFRDITERRRVERALMQSEKLAAVGRLAASIAHEINNPLESVTNLLYLARRSEDAAEIQGYLDLAERELRRVSAISNQTLRFHKQSTSPQSVSCQELIESVISVYQARLVNSRVQIEKRKRAQRPVLCFEGEIRQVLSNLVGNAIDAMHPRGGRLLIRSREGTNWMTGEQGLVLTFADSGPGMPPEVRRKIFEPFFTTKGIGGNGLGLWVSQEIVARHKGALRVRSSQRAGGSCTVFALFLPFAAVSR